MSQTDRPEPDDVTGHMPYRRSADAETDETDEVTGHRFRKMAHAEADETDDEVTGHRYRKMADTETDETDDVAGHGGPRGGTDDDGWPAEGRSPR